MTSPVSPLATLREFVTYHAGRADSRPTTEAALAVLDSLDGTITLSREEATELMVELIYLPSRQRHKFRALLAARIEESK